VHSYRTTYRSVPCLPTGLCLEDSLFRLALAELKFTRRVGSNAQGKRAVFHVTESTAAKEEVECECEINLCIVGNLLHLALILSIRGSSDFQHKHSNTRDCGILIRAVLCNNSLPGGSNKSASWESGSIVIYDQLNRSELVVYLNSTSLFPQTSETMSHH
jgi:hypothetical protein